MRTKHYTLLVLLPVVAGWVGYYLGAMRETSITHMPRGATVALDHLVSAESFSEVEQARAVLDALAVRYVENAQRLIAQEVLSHNANSGVRNPSSERPILLAIKMLDEAIPEFRGTGVELRLLRPLLLALKQERFYDRWLDVYLDALYLHPTHELVGVLADEAVAISQAAGREGELTLGFRHLSGIPLDFPAKSRIQRSIVRLCTDPAVVVNPCEHAT